MCLEEYKKRKSGQHSQNEPGVIEITAPCHCSLLTQVKIYCVYMYLYVCIRYIVYSDYINYQQLNNKSKQQC